MEQMTVGQLARAQRDVGVRFKARIVAGELRLTARCRTGGITVRTHWLELHQGLLVLLTHMRTLQVRT
jgi:hypothetical protein